MDFLAFIFRKGSGQKKQLVGKGCWLDPLPPGVSPLLQERRPASLKGTPPTSETPPFATQCVQGKLLHHQGQNRAHSALSLGALGEIKPWDQVGAQSPRRLAFNLSERSMRTLVPAPPPPQACATRDRQVTEPPSGS